MKYSILVEHINNIYSSWYKYLEPEYLNIEVNLFYNFNEPAKDRYQQNEDHEKSKFTD